jgi:hypothetical protein
MPQQAGPLYLDSPNCQGGGLSGLQCARIAGLVCCHLGERDAYSRLHVRHSSCHTWKWRCRGGTPTKRQVSKRQVSKRPVSKRLKRQVYKTSALQNVRFTKCQVYKTSGLQNIHIYSVLVVGGNPQVLLQPCLQAKGWLSFILYFIGFFVPYITIIASNK